MSNTALNQVLACAVAFGMAAAAWAAEGNQTKTPEQKAWEGVDSLDGESLRQLLQQFPDGDRAGDAKVALELQRTMSSIRAGKSKDRIAISLEVLGQRWKRWQKRNPDKGVVGYLAQKGPQFNSLGWFSPAPLSGGKTPGRNTFSFDEYGVLTAPTGDGSVVAFRTTGLKLELFQGIVFETPGADPMYFGVIEGKGLVHLRGAGKVTLPDGTTVELK